MKVKIPTALVQRESAKGSAHAEDFGCTNRASALVMIEEFKNIAKSRHSGFLPFVLPKSHILELVANIPRLNIDQSFRQPSPSSFSSTTTSSSTSTTSSLSSSTSSVETSTQSTTASTTTTPGESATATGTGTAKFFTRLHDTENEDHFEPYFYGSSTSTYPTMPDKDTREGEPICDQYRALLRSDYSVLALADGCNWGIGPAKAAHIAVKTFVHHIDRHRADVFDTNKLASVCVSAVLEAHNKIIRNKCNLKRVGTTTLIGGVVCKLSPLIVGRSIADVLPSLFHFSPPLHDPPSPSLSSSASSSPPGLSLNLPVTLSSSATSSSPMPSPSTSSSSSLSTSVPSSTTGIQYLWKSLTNLHQKVQGHDSHSSSSSSSSSSVSTANDSSSSVSSEDHVAGETGAGGDQGSTPMSAREEVVEDDMLIIKPWAFVFASIGDCKAFLWSRKTSTLSELTVDSRLQSSTNASDCGGRIGPFIEGAPDLSNLNVYCVFCDKDDIILLCSDGVYDNFDPQMLGFSPKDFDIPSDEWDSADSALINDLKVEYRNRFMNNLIDPLKVSSSSSSLSLSSSSSLRTGNLSAASISQSLVEQSVRTTQSSQRFMRDNPKRKLPLNYNQYPGKCDHTTIMSLQVSSIDPSLLSSSSLSSSSSSSSSRSHLKSISSSSSASSASAASTERAAKSQTKTGDKGSATSSGSSSSYSSPSVSPPPPPSPLHDQVLADLEMSPSPSFTFAKTPTLPSSTLFNLDNSGTDFELNSSPTANSSLENLSLSLSLPLRNAWKISLEKELQTYQPIDLIPPPHLIRPFTFPLRVSNPPPLSSSSSSPLSPSSPKSSSSSSQRKLSFSGINALRVFLSDGSHRSTKVVGSTTCNDVAEVLIEKIRLFQSNDSIDIDSYRLYIRSNDPVRKVVPVKSDELIMPLIYKGDFIFVKPSEIDSPSLSWFFSDSSPSASPSSSASSPSSSAENSPSSSSSSLLSSSSGDKKRKKYKANSFIARISQSKRDN